MQSYQRFQCIGHMAFNTSGTNGPRLPSLQKAGTHSALPTGSHTAAHRAKQGRFERGWYHYPQTGLCGSETRRGRVSEGQTLPLLGLGRKRFRRTQRASGTAMCLCASLFRDVAAPLGCVIFFAFVRIVAYTPCVQCFPHVRDEGWYHHSWCALRAAETPGPAC